MKTARNLSLTAILVALVVPALRAQQRTVGDSAAVAGVIERFNQALARGDSAGALALLAPDVAIPPIDAMNGFCFFARWISSKISWVGATAPPGESMRTTIAFTHGISFSRFSSMSTLRESSMAPSICKTPTPSPEKSDKALESPPVM